MSKRAWIAIGIGTGMAWGFTIGLMVAAGEYLLALGPLLAAILTAFSWIANPDGPVAVDPKA